MQNINALSNTKIWAFVEKNDKIVDPPSTRAIIEALKNKDTNAKLTKFDVPTLAYKNSKLINWLVNCGK